MAVTDVKHRNHELHRTVQSGAEVHGKERQENEEEGEVDKKRKDLVTSHLPRPQLA